MEVEDEPEVVVADGRLYRSDRRLASATRSPIPQLHPPENAHPRLQRRNHAYAGRGRQYRSLGGYSLVDDILCSAVCYLRPDVVERPR